MMVVTCEPVSSKQSNVIPAMSTYAVHLVPINPLGTNDCREFTCACDINTLYGLGHSLLVSVPACPAARTAASFGLGLPYCKIHSFCGFVSWLLFSATNVGFGSLEQELAICPSSPHLKQYPGLGLAGILHLHSTIQSSNK